MNPIEVMEFLKKKQKEGTKNILLDCGQNGLWIKNIETDLGNLKKVVPKWNNVLVFKGQYYLNTNLVHEIWGLTK